MSAPAIDLLDVNLFLERREHQAFRVLRDEAPVYFNREDDGPGFYAVTRYEDISEIVRRTDHFSNAKGTQIKDRKAEGHGTASVHNSDPPYHTKLRAFAEPSFRRKLVEGLAPKIRATVNALLDDCPRGETFDFVSRFAILLPMIVIGDLLGVPKQDQRRMVNWANTVSDVFATEAQQAEARVELFGFFRRLVALKRTEPGDDVATVLAHEKVNGELLTDGELDAYFMVLSAAGNETTRFLISGGLEQLCLQPETLEHLRRAPELIPNAVEEMIRWVAPVMQMRRTAIADTEIAGHPVKAGDKVVLYFASANRDERKFADAAQFSVTRTSNAHLGFGKGAHFCLGAHLARLESQIFFEILLERVPDIQLKGLGTKLPSYLFAGYTHLPMEWK
jgi:cytochrome P450